MLAHGQDQQNVSADSQKKSESLAQEEQRADSVIENQDQAQDVSATEEARAQPRRINKIIVSGNKLTSTEAILSYAPYAVGEIFNPQKTRQLIRNLYFGLKRFRNVTVKGEHVGEHLINLHIIVEEKLPLKEVIFVGNKYIAEKEIRKKVDFDIPAIDEKELKPLAQKIKRLYVDKGYFLTTIDTELQIDDDDNATAIFTIHEGRKSLVKRIFFTGNNHISSKELRNVVFTREDWILSFLDKTGTYHPDRLDADKHMIEQYYQNHGYLQAKVTDIEKDMDPETKHLTLTFNIEEGELFTINEVHAPGDEMLSEEFLLSQLPIRPGDFYSREKITDAIKALEFIWGNYGYIFAHIDPSIEPDLEAKTVNLTFTSELGNKVYLHKINIKGNKKTRDKVIRRKISLLEGELLTNRHMEISKHNVETLGYFDPRDGANWKINRLPDNRADLDLIVKEIKTGHFNAQMGFGGAGIDLQSPASGINFKTGMSDTNLFGSGIHLNMEATWSKNEQTFVFHLAQPWLFDQPISGAVDFYHRRPTYDELNNIFPSSVKSKVTGGGATIGFINSAQTELFNDMQVLLRIGIDDIRYQAQPRAAISTTTLPQVDENITAQYQQILDNEFTPGTYVWLAQSFEQDHRNHPIHPSRGHKWQLLSKIALPSFDNSLKPPLNRRIGFFKLGLDVNWFTPLIDEYDLVFRLHGYLGIIAGFKNRIIPFGELFHIGGPASVRGFNFGQIGPKFAGDSIGATKALFWNAELIFPITGDMSMKGVIFYDGGAGFSNPNVEGVSRDIVTGNNFDYRHSVGFGLRLLRPMPISIDWGFKIDPRINKLDPSRSESSHEIHFGMTYNW